MASSNNLVLLERRLRDAENRFKRSRCNKCSEKYLKIANKIKQQIVNLKQSKR